MDGIIVRRARPEDSMQLAALYDQLISKPTDVVALGNRLRENSNIIVLVAETGQRKLVGTVYGVICPDTVGTCQPFMTVDNLIVHADYRGRGIARSLMSVLEAIGHDAGCSLILLVSGADRRSAHRLYERLGYSVPVRGFKKYIAQ